MSITKIDYFLPITRARLTASVTRVTDAVVKENDHDMTTSHTFSLVTLADPDRPRVLRVEGGLLEDYSFEFGLTEDGRLTSTDVQSTGRATLVLVTGIAAAAAGAALLAGQLPLAAALAAGAVQAGEQALSAEEAVGPPEVDTAVWAAYEQAYPEPAQRTTRLLTLRAATESDLDETRDQLRKAAGEAGTRRELREQVATLRELLVGLEADLDELWKRFTAWRTGSLTESTEVYDELLPLDALPSWAGSSLHFPATDHRAQEFWRSTGMILATIGEPPDHTTAGQTTAAAEVRMLRPRQAVLAYVEGTDDRATVGRVDRVLVMDHACTELTLPIRKSRNGKRYTAARLSELGALTGISYGGTSSAAADAATLATLTAGASKTLGESQKSQHKSNDS